jgi:hypothetical protein
MVRSRIPERLAPRFEHEARWDNRIKDLAGMVNSGS